MACALAGKRSNFTCVLQRTHGLGVVPFRYDCTNGVMTFSWKLRSRLSVKCGMSSFQATRRASARSSSVQQPPYVVSAADRLSYICIDRPTTSWPPDMATAIFTVLSEHRVSLVHARFQVVQSVLVVDDDPNIRKMIIAALRREGYQFAEAPNGKEALDIMRAQHPSVVVLDLMMPIVSGWEVLQERENDPQLRDIPVIIVSATRAPEIASAVDKGICAFLPKPFDITALSALVRSCLPPSGEA